MLHDLIQPLICQARRFADDESGATAIEYGLIAALIALVIITGARRLGTNISGKFTAVASAIGSGSTVP